MQNQKFIKKISFFADLVVIYNAINKNKEIFFSFKSSIWLLIDRVIRLISGVFIGSWVIRYLGPEQYGNFSYVLSILIFFQVLANFGLDTIVIRELSIRNNQKDDIFNSALLVKFTLGIISFFSVILFYLLFSEAKFNDDLLPIISIAAIPILFQFTDVIDFWYQSIHKSEVAIKAKLFSLAVVSGLRIFAILFGYSLFAFALLLALDAVLGSIILVFYFLNNKESINVYPSFNKCYFLVANAIPILIMSLSFLVTSRVDQIIIKNLLGAKILGFYSSIYFIASFSQFIPSILNQSVAAYIHKLRLRNYNKYIQFLRIYYRSLIVISILISIFLIIFGDKIVLLLLGESYAEYSKFLGIYSLTNIFHFIGMSQFLWFINENKQRYLLCLSISSAFLGLITTYICILNFNFYGAVFASILVGIFSNYILPRIYFPELRKIFVW